MTEEYNILQRFFDTLVSIGYNIDSLKPNQTPAEICTQVIRQTPHVLHVTNSKTLFYTIGGKKRAFRNLKVHIKGNYGTLYLADSITIENNKPTEPEKIFIKIGYYKGDDAVFREALLQILAQCAFEKYNLSWAIPSVHDIMMEGDQMMFTIEPRMKCYVYETFLKNHIKNGVPCYENDALLFCVISQLATYVEILTNELQMTHRDMKCSNVLMVTPMPAVETITRNFPRWNITINTYLRAILIDFGMSCIPHNESKGGIFTPHKLVWTNDITPRDGRDLFLFFADLWRKQWIRDSITPIAQNLIISWIGPLWAKHLEEFGDYAWERSLFTKIGFTSFDCSSSNTIKVLTDISEKYPTIIQMELKE